jgi:hypothetical protein
MDGCGNAKTRWGWMRLQNDDVLLTAEEVNELIRQQKQQAVHNQVPGLVVGSN